MLPSFKKMPKWLKALGYTLLFFTFLALILLAPIDQMHYSEEPYFQQHQAYLADFEWESKQKDSSAVLAGWAQESIVPSQPSPMAGYGGSRVSEGLYDTLLVQSVVIKKGSTKLAVISIDLLIFPPALFHALADTLPSLGWNIDELYLTATHTHHGIGAWIPSFAGRFVAGEYNEEILQMLTKQTVRALQKASLQANTVELSYWETDVPQFVKNRINNDGKVDTSFKGIALKRKDGQLAVMATYAAHPTSYSRKDLHLSADYPANFRQKLVQEDSISFAMYLAGAVGSHGPAHPKGYDYDTLAWELGNGLAEIADSVLHQVNWEENTENPSISIAQYPLAVDDLQLRLGDDWGTRTWVFEWLMGVPPLRISCLQIGETLLLGTPCDFSGELALGRYQYARKKGYSLMINSFNGGYIGYITPDEYYHTIKRHELRDMNWTGPYTGSYFTSCLDSLIAKAPLLSE